MFIKKKLIFDRQIRNKENVLDFNFEECLESNEEYFFEYFQYNNPFTTPTNLRDAGHPMMPLRKSMVGAFILIWTSISRQCSTALKS